MIHENCDNSLFGSPNQRASSPKYYDNKTNTNKNDYKSVLCFINVCVG